MKRNSYYLLALLAGLLFSSLTFAQTRMIQGTVTDENKHPVSFASIAIKGSGKGTVSDKDGVFKLNVPAGATLIIRAVGFMPKEIPVGSEDQISVSLTENLSDLNEVVVTALGLNK